MRKTIFTFFILVLAIVGIKDANGQQNGAGLDSIPIIKPKKNQELYQFSGDEIRELQYSFGQPRILKYKDKKPLSNVTNGLLTMVTGLGFNSSREVIWKIDATVSSDVLANWKIVLFCDGEYSKERERVRDSDGSVSVETESSRILYWDKDATGAIMEGQDTVGTFLIIMDPKSDSLLIPWSDEVYSQHNEVIIPVERMKFSFRDPKADYGIIGTLRGKKFMLISNALNYRTWIYTDDQFRCIFRADMDDELTRKQERVMPFLLIDSDAASAERDDLFRLALMSRLIASALVKY